jgi:cyclopropane-fatty-acyl-phospholipid synthase
VISAILERDLLPDTAIRAGIRRIVASRLRELEEGTPGDQAVRFANLMEALHRGPIAIATDEANAQHYELPPDFFAHILGPNLKYSSAWWPEGVESLAEAETRMLELTAYRAQIQDGQRILDLGCGWGSLTMHLAREFPRCEIVAVSNAPRQAGYIMAQARARGFAHVSAITADINTFETEQRFDRIVSVEMLEHVRNHARLFARVRRWLADDGRFFAHVFSHRCFAYPYEVRNASDWMARYFFTGGMMPSDDLFVHTQDDLLVERRWRIDGLHYRRTAEAWLQHFDRHREPIDAILAGVYGAGDVTRWRVRWRVFFMACAEMFGFRGGQEWGVSHYRFTRRPT